MKNSYNLEQAQAESEKIWEKAREISGGEGEMPGLYQKTERFVIDAFVYNKAIKALDF